MHPNHTTRTGVHPRCPTCQKMLRTNGTCGNCEKPEVAEYYRLHAQGLRCCNICKNVLPLIDFALIRKGQERRRTVCTPCANAKNKAYRDANAARLKEYQDGRKQERHERYKQWYANPENRRKLRAYAKRWKKLNPDKDLEHYRKWQRQNVDKTKAQNLRRRALRLALPNNFTSLDWQHAVAHFHGCCAYCGNQPGLFHYTDLSAEHFIPLSSPDCPGTTPDNIIPVCLSCNSSRKGKDIVEWLSTKIGSRKAKKTLDGIASYFRQFATNDAS